MHETSISSLVEHTHLRDEPYTIPVGWQAKCGSLRTTSSRPCRITSMAGLLITRLTPKSIKSKIISRLSTIPWTWVSTSTKGRRKQNNSERLYVTGCIKKRLDNSYYSCAKECIDDINQVFKNCYIYFEPQDDIVIMAQNLEIFFKTKLKEMPDWCCGLPSPNKVWYM